jgi:23S rRNA maturation-related 3'-5' exoribonuclease YhaM
MNEPLIPLPFWRVFPPGLHVLLEITKKLWDLTVDDAQTIKAEVVGEQQAVLEAFRNLEAFVKIMDAAVAQIENEIFVSAAQLQECTATYQQALEEQHNRGDTVDQRMRIYELQG